MTDKAKDKLEPIVWVGAGLLMTGIVLAWYNLIMFDIGPLNVWLDNSIYRYLAFIPAFMSLLPWMNAVFNKQPICLRNSGIFLCMTLILPSMVLGIIAIIIVYGRGIAGSTTKEEGKAALEFSLSRTCEGDAFDTFPRSTLRIDIEKALAILKARDYTELSNSDNMCEVEKDGMEITVFSSGRLLVGSPDFDIASKTATTIYEMIVE